MFTELYLITTDPTIPLSQWFQTKFLFWIIVSILFHTFIYTLVINLTSFIFLNRFLAVGINTRLIAILIPFMFVGYLARYWHVQDIYKAYDGDKEKTRNHLDKLYISWLFIG